MVTERGRYILKSSSPAYREAAAEACIDVPRCGLVRSRDGHAVFWIERFDRQGPTHQTRLRVKDGWQLLEVPFSWKYLGNLETLVRVVCEFSSIPTLQLARFFDRVLFNWVIGNWHRRTII